MPDGDYSRDARSVHFLRFPAAKEEYYDPVIERQVKRMQNVIELARNIRERHNLSLKVGNLLEDCIRSLLTMRHVDTIEGAPNFPQG